MKHRIKFYLALLLVLNLTSCLSSDENLSAEKDVSQARPYAYVSRSLPVDQDNIDGPNASCESANANLDCNGRLSIDPTSPYQFNGGANLILQEDISSTTQGRNLLSSYFGSSDYDVKDLHVAADGKTMLFSAHAGLEGYPNGGKGSSWNIYEYNFISGSIRSILNERDLPEAAHDTSPVYTNDGRIAFSSNRQVAAITSEALGRLSSNQLCGSQDSRRCIEIVIAGTTYTELASLVHIVDIDGKNLQQVTDGEYHDLQLAMLADNNELAFVRVGGGAGIDLRDGFGGSGAEEPVDPSEPDNPIDPNEPENPTNPENPSYPDEETCRDVDEDTRAWNVTIRDFDGYTHKDFENKNGDDLEIVERYLGQDGKPVYAGGRYSGTDTTHGKEGFDQWYRDVAGINYTFERSLIMVRDTSDPDFPNKFVYRNNDFFPIDDDDLLPGEESFGNWAGKPHNHGSGLFRETYGTTREHNYHFTMETSLVFDYAGGETFTFNGDDDLWLFINGKLAINIGGVHGQKYRSIYLDEQAEFLDIEPGNRYRLDLFFAERRLTASNFEIETNIDFKCVDTSAGASAVSTQDLSLSIVDQRAMLNGPLITGQSYRAAVPSDVASFTNTLLDTSIERDWPSVYNAVKVVLPEKGGTTSMIDDFDIFYYSATKLPSYLARVDGDQLVGVNKQFTGLYADETLGLISLLQNKNEETYGGFPVILTGDFIDTTVTKTNDDFLKDFASNLYTSNSRIPDDLSFVGWFSAMSPYLDGSGRWLVSWSDCLGKVNGLDVYCGKNDAGSVANKNREFQISSRHGIWIVDRVSGTRLPLVRASSDVIYTDIAVSHFEKDANSVSTLETDAQ